MKTLPANATLIPKNAKQVFEGIIFDVYQWQQEMFDGSHKTFEMLQRPDTVQVIAVHDHKVLGLEEQQPGRPMYFRMPAGRVDEGEDWLTAAKRELLEETGLNFASWRLILVRQPIVKIEWFVATFIAMDQISKQAQSLDAGEQSNVLWFSLDKLKQRIDHEQSPLIEYLRPLIDPCRTIDELTAIAEFHGQEVDR